MTYQLRLSDWGQMSPAEQEKQLEALTEASSEQEGAPLAVLNARIKRYEMRYEMTSEELKQRLRSGTQAETAEIAHWLFLLDMRESCVSG